MAAFHHIKPITPPDPRLSDREFAVAWLVYRGLSNNEIAERLGISHFTVRSHLWHIFERLDMRCRTQLAMWVIATTGIWGAGVA